MNDLRDRAGRKMRSIPAEFKTREDSGSLAIEGTSLFLIATMRSLQDLANQSHLGPSIRLYQGTSGH